MILLDEPEWQPPDRGEVWLVSRDIRSTGDKKPFRPAVVMQTPAKITGRILIVTRTTDEDGDAFGAYSPEDKPNGLTKEGVWSVRDTVEASLWHEPYVEQLPKTLDLYELADISTYLHLDWTVT